MRCSIAALFVLIVSGPASIYAKLPENEFTDKIKHVVVLMLENRSFDHIAGYFDIPGINGLTGKEQNLLNPQNLNSTAITARKGAKYKIKGDPDHTPLGGIRSILGVEKEPEIYPDVAPMNGFVAEAAKEWRTTKKEELEDVMLAFDPKDIPVTYELAKQYAIFDAWYSSVPGPTHPNRLFAFTGTSNGQDVNSNTSSYVGGFPQKPFFQHLNEAQITWKVYVHDIPELIVLRWIRLHGWAHMKWFKNFKKDAIAGTLPEFSVIEPAYFGFWENDNHPPSDTRKAESLLKTVYDTLRASPTWNSTLLIITYDENGGIYDHVSPPMKDIPNPDGLVGKYIRFDRLGIRVPTIMVSPWIKPSVIHRPSEKQRPFPSSEFEHTSIIATLKKVWHLPEFLTKRDAWAGTFEDILSSDLRDDCPLSMPTVPKRPLWFFEKWLPSTENHARLMAMLKGAMHWKKFGGSGPPGALSILQGWMHGWMNTIRRKSSVELEREVKVMMDSLMEVEMTELPTKKPKEEELSKGVATEVKGSENSVEGDLVTATEALECMENIEIFFLQQKGNQAIHLDMIKKLMTAIVVM